MPKPAVELPECFDCQYENLGHPCRNPDGSLNVVGLARAYLMTGRKTDRITEADAAFWAFSCLNDIVTAAPQLAFRCVLAALDQCEGDGDIAYLSAGALEDLVVRHGPWMIDAIEEEAARNPRFRRLLSGIWGQSRSDPEVWSRIQRVLRQGPWLDEDPRTPQGSRRGRKEH